MKPERRYLSFPEVKVLWFFNKEIKSLSIMIDWLKNNEWIWTVVMGVCAVITLVYKLLHKEDKSNNQKIGDVNNSQVNQAGRDIKDVRQRK